MRLYLFRNKEIFFCFDQFVTIQSDQYRQNGNAKRVNRANRRYIKRTVHQRH